MASNTNIAVQYPPGTIVEVTVQEMDRHGALVRIAPAVFGWIPREEITWQTDRVDPRRFLRTGDDLEATVLRYDSDKCWAVLSLKRLREDPWPDMPAKLPVGAQVEVTVVSLQEFGAFARIRLGMEGLIPISEMSPFPIAAPEDALRPGDRVKCVVTEVDTEKRAIRLSVKAYLAMLADVGGKEYPGMQDSGEGVPLRSLIPPDVLDKLEAIGRQTDRLQLAEEIDAGGLPRCPRKPSRALNVLVADDKAEILAPLEELLQSWGHHAQVVSSGRQAVQAARTKAFDAIILDIAMPDLDGIAAMRQMRSEGGSAKIVLMTGAPALVCPIPTTDLSEACAVFRKADGHRGLWDILDAIAADRALPPVTEADLPLFERANFWQGAKDLDFQQVSSAIFEKMLLALEQAAGATASAVFRMDFGSRAVTVAALHGLDGDQVDHAKYEFQYTFVRDVIEVGDNAVMPDLRRSPGNEYWHGVENVCSCAGVPLQASASSGLGVFVFHHDPGHFSERHLDEMRLRAPLFAHGIELAQLELATGKAQPFALDGQLLRGIMHEVQNYFFMVDSIAADMAADLSDLSTEPGHNQRAHIRALETNINRLVAGGTRVRGVCQTFVRRRERDQVQLVDLRSAVNEAIAIVRPTAVNSRAALVFDVRAALPRIKGKKSILVHILTNLILNAVQQIELEKVREGAVEVRAIRNDSALEIRVSDNGPGIHADEQERIFDIMFTTRPDGAGLGLHFSKLHTQLMNGSLELESSVIFSGSTFLLRLPCRTSEVSHNAST